MRLLGSNRDKFSLLQITTDGNQKLKLSSNILGNPENILVLNPENGWIQNCNSTPYTSALEYSPKRENYPYYMSRDQENFRGIHAIELLKDKSEKAISAFDKRFRSK